MTIEYLLVTFPGQRNVLADGVAVGVTNHVLMLPGDEYQITLSAGGCSPTSQDIALVGTSLVKPLVVAFAPAAEAMVAAEAITAPVATASTDLAASVAVASPLRTAQKGPKPLGKTRPRASKPGTKAPTNE